MEERLQKIIAHAGIASRRHAEEMILAGRVRVNGSTVTELGTKVDPQKDIITVDGEKVRAAELPVYLILNKPPGYVTTAQDPEGRRTVLDLVPKVARLYPVGRLDLDSEGLVLLTNDGELANELMHPSFEHEKEYRVLINGAPDREALQALRQGIELEDGRTRPATIESLRDSEPAPVGYTWLRIVLQEGRKRQIRRMLAEVGLSIERLVRVRLGPLRLGRLKQGQWRRLTDSELRSLGRKPVPPPHLGRRSIQAGTSGKDLPAARTKNDDTAGSSRRRRGIPPTTQSRSPQTHRPRGKKSG
ncbi:MAG: rRNA pseudouridine synthase [Chloroflexi bacterium]|nr:rRNA pseudouridine synthase [Chloroflexota bacterium]